MPETVIQTLQRLFSDQPWTKAVSEEQEFSNSKELQRILTRISAIGYCQPIGSPSTNYLQQIVDKHFERCNVLSVPVKITSDLDDIGDAIQYPDAAKTAEQALKQVVAGWERWGDPYKMLDKSKRHRESIGAGNLARKAAVERVNSIVDRRSAWRSTLAGNAEYDAGRWAEWEWVASLNSIPRQYRKGNPFEPLIELYEKGYLPIGQRMDPKGRHMFVVFVPRS